MRVKSKKATDYIPDSHNANKGTEYGGKVLADSIAKTGLGRGIVVDSAGRVVAGNKTLQAAIDAGLVEVVEVETNGKQLLVHKRSDFDLTDKDPNNMARVYGYYDNRVSELNLDWDAEVLLADMQAGFEFDGLFAEFELEDIFEDIGDLPLDIDDEDDSGYDSTSESLHGGSENGDLPVSHVVMVQVFLNTETHRQFMEWLEVVKSHFGVKTTTDSIWEAVKYAHDKIE